MRIKHAILSVIVLMSLTSSYGQFGLVAHWSFDELGHSPVHPASEFLYFTIWKNGCTVPSFCYDSNSEIPTGVWHHFVAVVGEDYNTGYLNGEEMTNRWYNFGNSVL
jgi:hypothetical protein